jgi:4-hydroxy-tetrahydrodipicolinate reductase
VIQWATGDVGKSAVAGIVGHPDLELVGTWVHSQEKEGRDVGELCGLNPLGVRATRDKDALLAMPADCVCYTVGRSWMEQRGEVVAELSRILRAGKNVVNSTWPALVYPQAVGDGVYEQLQAACLAGGSTFYTTGIDPGFGGLGLALTALTAANEVRSVHTYEIMNYADWAHPEMLTFFGFGQSDNKNCYLATPGYTADIFRSTLTLLADAMGVKLDGIEEAFQVIYADEPFDIAAMHIARGTISGVRFQVKGMIDGEARFVVDHITKLRDQDFPEVPFAGGGYRAEIRGEPSVRLDLSVSSQRVAANNAALVSCALVLVNAIPLVCEAPPGVLSYRDLRPHPGKNLLRGRP